MLAAVPRLAVTAIRCGIVHTRYRLTDTSGAAAVPAHEAKVTFALRKFANAIASAVI